MDNLVDPKIIEQIHFSLEKKGVMDLVRSQLRIHILNFLKGESIKSKSSEDNNILIKSIKLDDRNREELLKHTRDLIVALQLDKTLQSFDEETSQKPNKLIFQADSKLEMRNNNLGYDKKNSETVDALNHNSKDQLSSQTVSNDSITKRNYYDDKKNYDEVDNTEYEIEDQDINESNSFESSYNESDNSKFSRNIKTASQNFNEFSHADEFIVPKHRTVDTTAVNTTTANVKSSDEPNFSDEEVPENDDSEESNSFEESVNSSKEKSNSTFNESQQKQVQDDEIQLKLDEKHNLTTNTSGHTNVRRLDQGIITRTSRWNSDTREDDNDYEFSEGQSFTAKSTETPSSLIGLLPTRPIHRNVVSTTHDANDLEDVIELDDHSIHYNDDSKTEDNTLNKSTRSSNQDEDVHENLYDNNEYEDNNEDSHLADEDDVDDENDFDAGTYLSSSTRHESSKQLSNTLFTRVTKEPVLHNIDISDENTHDDYNDDFEDDQHDEHDEEEIDEEEMSIGESFGSHGSDDPFGLNDKVDTKEKLKQNNLSSTSLSRTKSGALPSFNKSVYQNDDDDYKDDDDEETERERLAEINRRLAELEKDDVDGKLQKFKNKYDNNNSYDKEDKSSDDISVASENLDELDFSIDKDNTINHNKFHQSNDQFSMSEQEIESLNADNYEFVTNVQPPDRRK